MTTRDLANLIRDHLRFDHAPALSLKYADTITVPDPADERPASAEFVITTADGTVFRITVADPSQACQHPESAENDATFTYCMLCGEVTSE